MLAGLWPALDLANGCFLLFVSVINFTWCFFVFRTLNRFPLLRLKSICPRGKNWMFQLLLSLTFRLPCRPPIRLRLTCSLEVLVVVLLVLQNKTESWWALVEVFTLIMCRLLWGKETWNEQDGTFVPSLTHPPRRLKLLWKSVDYSRQNIKSCWQLCRQCEQWFSNCRTSCWNDS